jgi:hypothetical protein
MAFQLIDKRTGEVVFDGAPASRSNPCGVCSHLHRNQGWCLIDRQRGLTICPRVPSDKRIGNAGWLHGDEHRTASDFSPPLRAPDRQTPDFRHAWEGARLACREIDTARLAQAVRLPVEFVRLVAHGVERGDRGDRWVFPMRLPASGPVAAWPICGLKTRSDDGKKFCAKGSRIGLILCADFNPLADTLVVTEGESDLMVAASWGLNAVARAGCEQSVRDLANLSAGKRVLLIADKDEAGRRGASRLRDAMTTAQRVTIVEPPCKDLREWFLQGATRDDLIWKLKSRRKSAC